MELTMQEIIEAVSGKLIIKGSDTFNEVCTDTRKIQKDNLFIALKGANFNGNEYAAKAAECGASIIIIDEVKFDEKEVKGNSSFILVDDTRKALGALAKYYRNKLGIKVVGVTGSTGKTSTKDLIAAFLSGKYKVFKTQGNFNNDIGLPLMIFKLTKEYDIAVLEMGMNNFGEINYLTNIARPDVAAITNAGVAHIEYLKTRANILKEKMSIADFMSKDNTLIINCENDMLKTVKDDYNFKVKRTGYNDSYDVYASDVVLNSSYTKFKITAGNDSHEFTLNMAGEHNVLNALLAAAVSIEFNVSFDEMEKGLENFQSTSMRLEIINKKDFTIINDSYNANPDSMKAALNVLNSYDNKRKIAVLGTMGELGDYSKKGHTEVGEFAKDKCSILLTCGDFKNCYENGFKDGCMTFETKEEIIDKLKEIIKPGDVILIKASRSAKFEEIVKELDKIFE